MEGRTCGKNTGLIRLSRKMTILRDLPHKQNKQMASSCLFNGKQCGFVSRNSLKEPGNFLPSGVPSAAKMLRNRATPKKRKLRSWKFIAPWKLSTLSKLKEKDDS